MKTGFTLIELIIVIAVVAILATTVILVLNPATILQEARDSQRIADLGQMSSALSLYLATVNLSGLTDPLGEAAKCYANDVTGVIAANCGGRHQASRVTTEIASRAIDGTGWVPVNIGAVAGGAPLSVWPVDPTNNNTALFYSYATGGGTVYTYEINANMESDRYAAGGTDDVEGTDGGSLNSGATAVYEIGNDPNLDL